jgi:putative PIN family toxin of toxin-antitoxin system
MRVILDTNVLVSAVLSRRDERFSGPRWIVDVALLGQRRFEHVTSEPLMIELCSVLQRRADLDRARAERFVRRISGASTYVSIRGLSMGTRDPRDDKVVETAINGNVDVVVSGDSDLHDVRVQWTLGKTGIGIRSRPILVWTVREFLDAFADEPRFSPLVVPATVAA